MKFVPNAFFQGFAGSEVASCIESEVHISSFHRAIITRRSHTKRKVVEYFENSKHELQDIELNHAGHAERLEACQAFYGELPSPEEKHENSGIIIPRSGFATGTPYSCIVF